MNTTKRERKNHNMETLFYKVLLFLTFALLAASISQGYSTAAKLKEATQQIKEATAIAEQAQDLAMAALAELETVNADTTADVSQKSRTATMTVTAYCGCPKCCGIWSDEHPSRVGTGYVQKTASGTVPVEGRTIAVDPEVIPFGTRVSINGKEYIAEDTGSAVKGDHIDVFFDNHQRAVEWGKQTLEVTIFED